MKTTYIIAIIALIAQVTLAGNIGRVKRSDDVEDLVRDSFHIVQDIIDMSIKFFDDLYEHVPETEEFATFREDIYMYTTIAKLIKEEEGNCILKTYLALAGLKGLLDKYDDENSTEVSAETSKAITELFLQYGGEEFKKSIEEFEEKYYNEEFIQKVANYKKEDVEKWTLFTEVC